MEATGYESASRQVTVSDSASVTADFDLVPLARGTLSGTVTDDEGDPVARALVAGAGPEGWRTTTGPDGSFLQEGLLDGTYTVTVAADGYLTEETTIEFGTR